MDQDNKNQFYQGQQHQQMQQYGYGQPQAQPGSVQGGQGMSSQQQMSSYFQNTPAPAQQAPQTY
jgi:hypothetical protein